MADGDRKRRAGFYAAPSPGKTADAPPPPHARRCVSGAGRSRRRAERRIDGCRRAAGGEHSGLVRRVLIASVAAIAAVTGCSAAAARSHATGGPPPAPAAAPAKPDVPFAATPGSAHDFADVEQWRKVFDDPARDTWQKPRELIASLDLRPGMWVADLGAGTGYFSRWLDGAVGPSGVVFAVDTEPNLVAYLRARSEREKTTTVVPVLASPDDPRLPPHALDLVLIVDTYHHIDDRRPYLEHLATRLKPDGRVVVVDWQKHDLAIGPPIEHRLARAQVVREMETAGYTLAAEPSVLPHQYVLVFARPGR